MSTCGSRKRAPRAACGCCDDDDDGLELSNALDRVLCDGEQISACGVPNSTTSAGVTPDQAVNAVLCVVGAINGNPAACAAVLRDLLTSRGL